MVLPFGLGSDGTSSNTTVPTPNPCVSRAHIITPSAPPAEAEIHLGPYIDFIVVNGDDRYMIRTERKAVLESSVELAKILNAGPTSGRKNDNHFLINNVNKNDFELLVRFLETKFIKFKDHHHILRMLELADFYNCPDLVIHCIRELDLTLTADTVLDVFRSLWYYSGSSISPLPNIITSEGGGYRRKVKTTQPTNNPFTPEEFMVALLNNALQLIDMHAELILTKDEMKELRFEELEMITKREALQLHSETPLFLCLADWSVAECRRKHLELTDENRRRVLGPLCYAPRYLTMSMREFSLLNKRVELLDLAERELVIDILEKKNRLTPTTEQSRILELFRSPRPAFAKMPTPLSDRTNRKNYPKKMRKAEKADNGEAGCCEKFGMNCLTLSPKRAKFVQRLLFNRNDGSN